MPKDTSIRSVLIIGSGPIIIGQACEFDYSGTQAARSLREEGIKVILINSNPATIMTDPMMADRVYLLPLTVESIEKILQENEIDAVLPDWQLERGPADELVALFLPGGRLRVAARVLLDFLTPSTAAPSHASRRPLSSGHGSPQDRQTTRRGPPDVPQQTALSQ